MISGEEKDFSHTWGRYGRRDTIERDGLGLFFAGGASTDKQKQKRDQGNVAAHTTPPLAVRQAAPIMGETPVLRSDGRLGHVVTGIRAALAGVGAESHLLIV